MTACPTTGTLRASIDGEATAEATAHAAACDRCQEELADLQATAAAADAALALLAPPATATAPTNAPATTTGPAPAWAEQPPTTAPPVRLDVERRRRRGSAWQRRAAAAVAVLLMAGGLVGTPAGREAAASFLSAFRSEQIAVVTVDPWSAGHALGALEEFADVDGIEDGLRIDAAPSLAAAEARVGFPVSPPDPDLLPERFGDQPAEILTMTAREVRIAFDEADLAAHLDRTGAEVAVPPGLGDTTLVVALPNAVALTYRGPDFEQLVVGESELVTADTEGPVPLDAVRDFLLELPELPPATVQQLRAIDDWRTTLPLPVPADGPAWRDTTVAGHDAVLLDDVFGSALLWQAEGRVRGVGGVADAASVQRIAEGLAR